MDIKYQKSTMLLNVSQGQRSNRAFSVVQPGVIKLNSGDPNFATPLHIRDASYKAMNNGYTHYCHGLGDKELRQAICNSMESDYRIQCKPDNILITNGAAGAIFLIAISLLEKGNEAIVFDPSYSLYETGIRASGAEVVRVPLTKNFHYNENELLKKITPKTKLIFLNNPNNPTATCFSKKDLESIGEIAHKNDLLVIVDEVYHKLVFDGKKHICARSVERLKDRTIIINSFSKTYAMTGWRIGYIVASQEIIAALVPLNRAMTGSVNTISQRAALAALQSSQNCVLGMIQEYEKRRNIMYSLVNKIKGLECSMPEGAFYVFCKFDHDLNAEEMTNFLMENGVAVRSGTEFGSNGEKHIRLTFAASLETIEQGLEKIDRALLLL